VRLRTLPLWPGSGVLSRGETLKSARLVALASCHPPTAAAVPLRKAVTSPLNRATAMTTAPEGARLSPPSNVSGSPPAACQIDPDPIEPECTVSTCMPRAGGTVLSRRSLMNKIVAVSVATAVPTVAPALRPKDQIQSMRRSNSPRVVDAFRCGRFDIG
jgi:hypothetical protein